MAENELRIELSEKLTEQFRAKGQSTEGLTRLSRRLLATELFRTRCLSLGQAAELAGTERSLFTKQLSEAGVPLIDLPREELQKEFETVAAMLRKDSSG